MVGYSLGFIGVLLTLVQAGLIRLIIPKLGLPKSILLGLLFISVSLFAIGAAQSTLWLFIVSIFYVCGGIAGPAIQSSISNLTPANQQGQIQGAITSVVSVTAIFGPVLMTSLFSYFTQSHGTIYFPGAPFYLGGTLVLVALLIAWNYFRGNTKH